MLTEATLLAIIISIFALNVVVARQGPGKIAVIFLGACLAGALAQMALGPDLNQYTENVSFYAGYVSVGIVLAWGIALTSMWSLHVALCRITGWQPRALLYVLCGVPSIIILEAIGSNVLTMRLRDFADSEPLMPITNSMRAPAWLFGYYAVVAILFYLMLKTLRMHAADWSRVRFRRPAAGEVEAMEEIQ